MKDDLVIDIGPIGEIIDPESKKTHNSQSRIQKMNCQLRTRKIINFQ